MSIRQFEHHTPHIDSSCYIDPSATVIGRVEIGAHSSVWPTAVIRGDINTIEIGEYTSIQDGTVIHVTHASDFHPGGFATRIGSQVTVGHRVMLHGCTIHDYCLIGMSSMVMDDVIIESDVLLGAGSLVPPGKVLEGGFLWLGSPAKKIRPLTNQEREQIRYSAQHYAKLADRYRAN